MCILRFYALLAYLQHYQTLLQELQEEWEDQAKSPAEGQSEAGDRAETYQHECKIAVQLQFQCCMWDLYLIPGLQRNVLQRGTIRPSLSEQGFNLETYT